MPRYRLISHTADLGAYFYGRSPAEVFENAAEVLTELLTERPPREIVAAQTVRLEGLDRADLLVRWLNEVLFYFHARGRAAAGARVREADEQFLLAELDLADYRPDKHGRGMEIKAATYHRVEFAPRAKGWRARIIFDL